MFLLVGYVIGGGLSMVTRSRWLLVGAAAVLLVGARCCTTDALLCLGGFPLLTVVSGLVSAPIYVALAEELDQRARIWKAVVVAALMYAGRHIAENLASFVLPVALPLSHPAPSATAVLASVVALASCAVLAYALPGQPFRWAVTTNLQTSADALATYRPAPAVVRRDSSPSRWIPLLATIVAVLSRCATAMVLVTTLRMGFHAHAHAWRLEDWLMPSLLTRLLVGLLVAALAVAFANRDSRVAPTWLLGAGLTVQAVALCFSIAAHCGSSGALAQGASILDGIGQGLTLAVAVGCTVGSLSSRWAGLSAAGCTIVGIVAFECLTLLAVQPNNTVPLFATMCALLMLAAIAAFALGPYLQRNQARA
jgi:hypothetical protein